MPTHSTNEIRESLGRIYRQFDRFSISPAGHEQIKTWLSHIARGYWQYRVESDDVWMSRTQIEDALRSIQHQIRRAKVTMNNPVILRHLDANHPHKRAGRSSSQDLSEALSATGWALSRLQSDFEKFNRGSEKRQRRTRTTTRDEFLIPQLTRMLHAGAALEPSVLYIDMHDAEEIIRQILTEWAVISGDPSASNYGRIARKPLRRIIRSTATEFEVPEKGINKENK